MLGKEVNMADYKKNPDGTWTMKIANYERTLAPGGKLIKTVIHQDNVTITTNYKNGMKTSTSYDGPMKKVKWSVNWIFWGNLIIIKIWKEILLCLKFQKN